MEKIFIDTSIFIKENFLEGKRITELLRLSRDGSIQIILTRITINEIKANYKKQLTKAIESFGLFKNEFNSKVLRNNKIGDKLFLKLKQKELLIEFEENLDKLLLKSKVIIIEYDILNIQLVFDSYFNSKFPFNSGEKKSEFPDAFAIALIEKWANENGEKIVLFSKDKDFLKTKSKFFTVEADYENYLDEKLKLILEERKYTLDKLFYSNSSLIDNTVKEWYIDTLYDESLYYPFIFLEIHNINEPEIEIVDKKYQIVSIEEESIEIEISVSINYKVTLEIDDEANSYYDDEEKEMHYFDTTTYDVKGKDEATVFALVFVINKNDFEDKFEITEINKDHKFEIEDENGYSQY